MKNIKWLGHASFLIEGEKIVYFDPWKVKKGLNPADIILVSHNHYDHCSPEDIKKIIKKDTVIIAGSSCNLKFSDAEIKNVKSGDVINISDIKIEVFPAYNINKSFHPKSSGGVGFIVTVSGKRIYHCGDTDLIPEMEKIKCDVALLAVSGTYVMTAEEAVEAAKTIKPEIAIPMHFGDIVGSINDANKFIELCKKNSIKAELPTKI